MRCKLIISLLIIAIGLKSNAQTLVKSIDPNIHYMGRVAKSDTAAVLSWSGNSVMLNFTGTGIKAVLNNEGTENFYNIIIDGKVISVLHPDAGKKDYVLAANLPKGKHTLELFKRTEWAMGKTWFYGFEVEGGNVLPPSPSKKHKIEIFGNSISCGYAVEDTTGKDRGTGPFENGYISYAAITARYFDAEFYNTSKSGIGVTVSWFPLIMPEMYDRLDATDLTSKWDFSKYTPDLVIINLFQNDSWIVQQPDNPQFKARFGTKTPTAEFITNAYANFVKSVRGKYPKAKILCILGSMDATRQGSPWPGYIEKAVSGLNDKNIYKHFIPYKNTNGHPNVKEQQAMADDLIAYIDGNIKW
jgi:hypothetical protein